MHVFLKDGTHYEITPDLMREFQGYYPRLDVEECLREAAAWCFANPSRRKTKRGIKRFLNTWLANQKKFAPKQPDMVFAQSHQIARPIREQVTPRHVGREILKQIRRGEYA